MKGSAQGGNRITVVGNRITVVGDTTVTISNAQDIRQRRRRNTYIVGAGIRFTLTQQAGQSGNTLDLSTRRRHHRPRADAGRRERLPGRRRRDGSINSLAGATALVSNLDIQIFVGVAARPRWTTRPTKTMSAST